LLWVTFLTFDRFDTETGVKTYLRQKWRRSTHGDHQASEGEILAVAVSTDGKYVASGGRDSLVRIFDARTNSEIKSLSGHRDAVTCLAFRRDSPSLFSGSLDRFVTLMVITLTSFVSLHRCIKHWDMNEMGYLETLFGHQVTYLSSDFSDASPLPS
jgi:ribosomal RNA-processing protein 9